MPHRPRDIISHRIFPKERSVLVRPGAQSHFRHMTAGFQDLIRRAPEIVGYDYVLDLTAFCGDAFHDDVAAIARAHRAGADARRAIPAEGGRGPYTCFATPDPNFRFWARPMDEMFDGRAHRLFASVEESWRFLGRRPAAGGHGPATAQMQTLAPEVAAGQLRKPAPGAKFDKLEAF
jgi:hypothetical protein